MMTIYWGTVRLWSVNLTIPEEMEMLRREGILIEKED
jgi:hypothetical protein